MAFYIVDDDEALGRTIARIISRSGREAIPYTSAEAFLNELPLLQPGSILLDINMPNMTGLQLIEILSDRCPQWPVVMISGSAEVESAIQAFRNGAIHFVRKPFRSHELLAAVEEAQSIAERNCEKAQRIQEASVVQMLTSRERQILEALAEGQQSKRIAWELGISTRTVEMHRSNVLAKLGARNTSQAVGLFQLAEALQS